jgi:TonB family protein
MGLRFYRRIRIVRGLVIVTCGAAVACGCAENPPVGTDSDKTVVAPRASPARTPTPPANKRGNCAGYYPPELRSAGVEGTTLLLVHVDETGNVRDARVEGSSGNARLDEQAVACVVDQGWFMPPVKDGRPVESWQRMKWTWKVTP